MLGKRLSLSLLVLFLLGSSDPPQPVEEIPPNLQETGSRLLSALRDADREALRTHLAQGALVRLSHENKHGVTAQALTRDEFLERGTTLRTWQCPFTLEGASAEPHQYLMEFACSEPFATTKGQLVREVRITLSVAKADLRITGVWVSWMLPDEFRFPLEP